MAVFCTGDMWQRYPDAGLFLITTNNVLMGAELTNVKQRENKRVGEARPGPRLVMGGGIAAQALERFPGIDYSFGAAIWSILSDGEDSIRVREDYCLLVSRHWPRRKLGAFQTKRHYKNPSILSLIQDSTTALKWWAMYHTDTLICLNFPGIGLGGLAREEVFPIVQRLPDNVEIWEYE